ncbi:AmpG family muropeptide MFS transporter [Basfia succiniciproducens]|uniref:MFS transporter, PAT family, beta-lactamase induction signal transducer AmpG n=1 Tax=Basfia succiniciproducens TaxID=653940 RepID=A0A1G5C0X2_9PAST|nr:AmpG family muropeptide MFS transporter [Basfia succiniciproducens]QIM68217.1 AmpG family muropeptide MFS transporter [Basfia succiniciproducens]SCX96095.1 MFS transporter, PAT family, beta-lactamase induction signal transducer AmpG [Basfia succiniciproducens]SEQ52976.1 MFS transporter, PAT family, beta-lactamase induction signal transducer AmpG [Basfia succiniciproducens]
MSQNHFFSHIFNRNMLICIFTGFSSGLPLYILTSLIPTWLRSTEIDLKTIGFFTLTSLPFIWKFLWSPFLDRFVPPFLGRRRGWMLIFQLLLLISLGLFGFIDPHTNLGLSLLIGLATMVSFFSASQDIVLDAYRREILSDQELGMGNSIHVSAYRIAGLVPGSLSLILSDHFSWQAVFIITALFMLPGLLMTLFISHEPQIELKSNRTLAENIVEPFKEFFQRKGLWGAIGILTFIFLYKFGDSMATALISAFYLDMGFTKTQIGLVVKNASLWPMIIAGIIGGMITLKIGINKALWLFGLVQIVTILGFAWLAQLGPFEKVDSFAIFALTVVVMAEYVGIGLGTSAFVAFMARATNPVYTATQLALFTSLSALPRAVFNSFSGVLIENMGYYHYFWLCFFLAIPGMLCLIWVAPWKEK